jgi:hypothetical protein
MIQNADGEFEGKRMMPFDYTMKRMIGISERDKMRRNEINRVKGLVGDRRVRQGWAGVMKRPAGVLFEEDELCCIPGIGKKMKKKSKISFLLTQ